MNDFLKNLKNSGDHGTPSIKKNTAHNYFTHNERHIPKGRRPATFIRSNPIPQKEAKKQDIEELIPIIAENTARLFKEVGRMSEVSEMLMETQMQQQNAMAEFFNVLKSFMANRPCDNDMPIATTGYALATHYTKDDIIAIINRMRSRGATLSTIAEYLTDKGVPTFSGRGQWHAQTIHRLCKHI